MKLKAILVSIAVLFLVATFSTAYATESLPRITTACEYKSGVLFAVDDGFSVLKKCPKNARKVAIIGEKGDKGDTGIAGEKGDTGLSSSYWVTVDKNYLDFQDIESNKLVHLYTPPANQAVLSFSYKVIDAFVGASNLTLLGLGDDEQGDNYITLSGSFDLSGEGYSPPMVNLTNSPMAIYNGTDGLYTKVSADESLEDLTAGEIRFYFLLSDINVTTALLSKGDKGDQGEKGLAGELPEPKVIDVFPIGAISSQTYSSTVNAEGYRELVLDAESSLNSSNSRIYYSDDEVNWIHQGQSYINQGVGGHVNRSYLIKGKYYRVLIENSITGYLTLTLY